MEQYKRSAVSRVMTAIELRHGPPELIGATWERMCASLLRCVSDDRRAIIFPTLKVRTQIDHGSGGLVLYAGCLTDPVGEVVEAKRYQQPTFTLPLPDPVGEAMESVERFNRRMQQTPLSPVLPDLTEMWARVFKEGVK